MATDDTPPTDPELSVVDAGHSSSAKAGVRPYLITRIHRHWQELTAASLALGVLVVLSYCRLLAARSARWPGHADPAFYFNVAQNIDAGRGATTNYVWEFLSPSSHVSHYAFGYWLPLPSLLMSVGLKFGNGFTAALNTNILMTVLMAIGTYLLARCFVRSPWLPAAAALIVLVQPGTSQFAMQSEGAVYLAAFATLAMAAAVGARNRMWLWPVTGFLAGLANLSRSEGLLLILALLLASLVWDERGRWFTRSGGLIGGYLIPMLPLFVVSMRHTGSPLPPAGSNFPFITTYEDLFALHVDHSLNAFLGGSWGAFASLRLTTLASQLATALATLTAPDAVILIALSGVLLISVKSPIAGNGMAGVRRFRQSNWLVPVAFAAAIYLFDALVAPVVSGAGAMIKVMVTLTAPLVVAGVTGLDRLNLKTWSQLLLCVALVAFPLQNVNTLSKRAVATNNAIGDSAARLKGDLRREQACLSRPLVLMTRNPWEITQTTGFPTVQIPNGSLDDILFVARKYGATDLFWSEKRAALTPLAALLEPGGPIEPSLLSQKHRVYRLTATVGKVLC